jgi:hypothetical protein
VCALSSFNLPYALHIVKPFSGSSGISNTHLNLGFGIPLLHRLILLDFSMLILRVVELIEKTPSHHTLPPEDLPSPGDLFSQQAGISVSACRTKCPRTDTKESFSPSLYSGLMLVCFDLQGTHVCIAVGEDNSLTRGLWVLPPSPITGAVASVMVGPSSLGIGVWSPHP